jgi:hypothetical protein
VLQQVTVILYIFRNKTKIITSRTFTSFLGVGRCFLANTVYRYRIRTQVIFIPFTNLLVPCSDSCTIGCPFPAEAEAISGPRAGHCSLAVPFQDLLYIAGIRPICRDP